jgi:GntR family transcriptional regulator / MocR family aminotransferase
MRRLYRTRRDALVDVLRKRLGSVIQVSRPPGGMALWARVDPAVDLERWAVLGLERGVGFVPGSRYAFDGGPVHALRLGFSPLDEGELEEAVRRMRAALAELGRSARTSARSSARTRAHG